MAKRESKKEPPIEEVNEEAEEEEEEEEVDSITIFDILDAPRDLPEPIPLTYESIKQVVKELGLIKLCWPEIPEPEFEGRTKFPESYLTNTEKEKMLLLFAENFRRQFCYKFPDRKQLFLASDNECGLTKMVCNTLCPTTLPYPEIETWQDCARFVADHITYEPLPIPTLIPDHMYSPHTTVLRQSGHCFEIANVLCSLLLGLGYDAYIVYGYACKDITLNILSRIDSPYPEHAQEPVEEAEEEDEAPVVEEKVQKYQLKAARDLRSKFLLMLEQRAIDKKKEEERIAAEAEVERRLLEEVPPPDDLGGQRIFAWVLLLDAGRKVERRCFINPVTGLDYPLDSPMFDGIETIWNNVNYWVNMQECSLGISSVDYDFTNIEHWEHLLIGEPIDYRNRVFDGALEDDEIKRIITFEEKHIDVPPPWSLRIDVPHAALKMRYPKGGKEIWYKRAFVQEFAPYVQEDGITTKITRFDDFDCTKPLMEESFFQHRHDKMKRTTLEIEPYLFTEYFDAGREDAVIKHSYYMPKEEGEAPDSERIIEYQNKNRYDNIEKIVFKDESMTEYYIGREDCLTYRYTTYALKGFPPAGMIEGHRRIILNITEKFSRNEKKAAEDDIATRYFDQIGREIDIKYHYAKGNASANSRHFIKPSLAEMGEAMKFNPEKTSGYISDVSQKPPKNLYLFTLLQKQLEEEEKTLKRIRELEDEVADFINLRNMELALNTLDVDLFNQEHNEEYRLGMIEREKEEKQQKAKEVEEELDYISPYIAKFGTRGLMNKKQALAAREACLNDFKRILLQRAYVIQGHFEETANTIKDKKQNYVLNLDKISVDEEMEYFEEMNNLNFVLHTMEERLKRHRAQSRNRYAAMVRYLDGHPKLAAMYE